MSAGCDRPLELAQLADYWFAELAPDDEDRAEEHLLGCGSCSGHLRALASLGAGVRQLARQGDVGVVITASFLEMAARDGLRTREYRVVAGGRVACTVTPEDDLVVARLVADFAGVSRVDLVSQMEGGAEQRIEDIPIRPEARELLFAQSVPALRLLGRSVSSLRLLARDASGPRLLGEYVFDHTPTQRE